MAPRLDLIGIVTADLAASLAFYRLLDVDIPEGAEHEPHVEVKAPGGMRLAWDPVSTVHSFDPGWTKPVGGHHVALAFAGDDPADVDATYSRITAAGYPGHLEPWDAPWGMRYAVIHDPDGNSVELFAPLPGSEPPPPAGE